MDRTERVVQLFENGLNCSQAMLVVFGEPHGLDLETAKRLGRPLGGGMGRLGRVCGAVSGAIVVLGLAQLDTMDESEARNDIARFVRELVQRFEDRHGTTLCNGLLGADMSTETGMRKIKEEKLVPKLCPAFVRDAAEILSELLRT
jgi:C_GCAxxG_C_C family probable redox protein